MRLTKLGHACVRLEKSGAAMVIDPGVWSGPRALDDVHAVLVTHEHFDHVDTDALRAAMGANPSLELWASASVAGQFGGLGPRVHEVRHGDTFTAAGFDVHVYGSEHARLHRDIPVIPNTGFAVDAQVFHPGDALTVPEDPVPILLLPANAPWLKVSELIDYAREVAPSRAYAVHDGLLNDNGLTVLNNWLRVAAEPLDATFSRLEPGTGVDL